MGNSPGLAKRPIVTRWMNIVSSGVIDALYERTKEKNVQFYTSPVFDRVARWECYRSRGVHTGLWRASRGDCGCTVRWPTLSASRKYKSLVFAAGYRLRDIRQNFISRHIGWLGLVWRRRRSPQMVYGKAVVVMEMYRRPHFVWLVLLKN